MRGPEGDPADGGSRHMEPQWLREARALGLPIRLDLAVAVEPSVVAHVDGRVARDLGVCPVAFDRGRLVIAAAHPAHAAEALAELQFMTGEAVELVATDPAVVHGLIARYYPSGATTETAPQVASQSGDAGLLAGYVDQVIRHAVEARASDVHFEPDGGGFQVRIRVDGSLRSLPGLPLEAGPEVVSRLKMLAGMDIGDTRHAQDGRFEARVEGRVVDVRVATLPTVRGECAVLRLLDPAFGVQTLEALGMPPECRSLLGDAALGPGLILACGPTGAGKTTTLHALVRSLDRQRRKVLSVEDPVEYTLRDVVQVQARPEIGLDFGRALRSFLRHDPDVILVGEIRDAVTARTAAQAALTGHLVLASLHCSGAAMAPLRLVDLGLEPWLVGSTVRVALAQRLVRCICERCRGSGECPDCGSTGWKGRAALFEWLQMTPSLSELLEASAFTEFADAAQRSMPCSLQESARSLLAAGRSSRDELLAQVGELE